MSNSEKTKHGQMLGREKYFARNTLSLLVRKQPTKSNVFEMAGGAAHSACHLYSHVSNKTISIFFRRMYHQKNSGVWNAQTAGSRRASWMHTAPIVRSLENVLRFGIIIRIELQSFECLRHVNLVARCGWFTLPLWCNALVQPNADRWRKSAGRSLSKQMWVLIFFVDLATRRIYFLPNKCSTHLMTVVGIHSHILWVAGSIECRRNI